MSRDDFIHQPMLTCIGNKRKMVHIIEDVLLDIKKQIKTTTKNKSNKNKKLRILDGFCGSTVVARMLSYHASKLYTNDMELYSYIMAKCFLQAPSLENQAKITSHLERMNTLAESGPFYEGIISQYYAPKNTKEIKEGERCFYTRENALIIDTLRKYIDDNVEAELQHYCLGPLLVKASIHTNTAGGFKAFYKKDGVGCFGGSDGFALSRILKKIKLEPVIWNNDYSCVCYKEDINSLLKTFNCTFDLIYLDPPSNQHPYGSNYFMLNVIAENKIPLNISSVSGIPVGWNKSVYNNKAHATIAMKDLVEVCLKKSKFLLISYNNEGLIDKEGWQDIFKNYNVKIYEVESRYIKGSKHSKDSFVEQLFLVFNK